MRRFRFARTLDVQAAGGSLEVWLAQSFGARLLGLAGVDAAARGLLIPRCRAVHTYGMRFGLDVAFLEWPPAAGCAVLRLHEEVGPRRALRLAGRRTRDTAVLEAPAGTFLALGVRAGATVGVRGCGGRGAAGPPAAACAG